MRKNVVAQFIELINIAYSDAPADSEEKKWQENAKIQHRQLVEGEW